jgi:transcriptional regulator GlxA family with amidase domain
MAQADLRNDEELLAVIETRLENENVVLTPEFGIADVAQLVGTTQTRIAELYKQKTIYHSVDKYLDFLRLMRALNIIKDKPGYSIEAIAIEAGFNSVRTMQRKIQEAIGLTPGQYRELVNPT